MGDGGKVWVGDFGIVDFEVLGDFGMVGIVIPAETPGIGDFGGTAYGLFALFGIVDIEVLAGGEAGIGDFGGEARIGDFGGEAGETGTA